MADWEVALERQAATWAWHQSPAGHTYIDGFVRDVTSKYPEMHALESTPALLRQIDRMLWDGEPIFVTKEMCRLVMAAMESFEPEAVREEDLFLPNGFAYLAEPAKLPDVWGKGMMHRAIAWHLGTDSETGDRGVHIGTFAGAEDEDDYFAELSPAQRQRHRDWVGWSLTLGHTMPIRFGSDPKTYKLPVMEDYRDRPIPTPEAITTANTRFWTFLQVLWRLMGQRIAVGHRVQVTRPARRRLEKGRWAEKEKYVTVVTLRRPRSSGEPEHRSVDWSQRWIVSGHWRWQPYGDGSHRQIWIAPYVKGPEDRPLVVRGARVFRWAR